jgi:hypothetical protein
MRPAAGIAAEITELAQFITDEDLSVSPDETAALMEGMGALLMALSLEGAIAATIKPLHAPPTCTASPSNPTNTATLREDKSREDEQHPN